VLGGACGVMKNCKPKPDGVDTVLLGMDIIMTLITDESWSVGYARGREQ